MLQPNVDGLSSQLQTQQIMITPTFSIPNNKAQKIQKYKKILRNLAMTEIILGVFSILLEIVAIATINSGCNRSYRNYGYSYPYYDFSYRRCHTIAFGAGIWCGIWIVIAGGLGIPCGKKNSSGCLIKSHMAFSIVGAVFSGVLFSTALSLTFVNYKIISIVLNSILCFISFTAIVLLIVSASYCCVVQGCGCCVQAHTQPYCGQVCFTPQPLVNQQMSGNLPGIGQLNQPYTSGNQYAIQPVMMQPVVMQSSMMQPGVMQPTPNVNNPYIQNIQEPKQILQQNLDAGQTANSPPTYDNLSPS